MTRSFADMKTEPMSISDGEVDVEGDSDNDDGEDNVCKYRKRVNNKARGQQVGEYGEEEEEEFMSDSEDDEFEEMDSNMIANNNNNNNKKNGLGRYRSAVNNNYRNNDIGIRNGIRDAMNDCDDSTTTNTNAIYCQSVNADHDYQKKVIILL